MTEAVVMTLPNVAGRRMALVCSIGKKWVRLIDYGNLRPARISKADYERGNPSPLGERERKRAIRDALKRSATFKRSGATCPHRGGWRALNKEIRG